MTVSELIRKLSAFPPDHRVLVNGYEYNLDDAREPREVKVKLNANVGEASDDFAGKHEEADDGTLAVLIQR